MKTLIGIGVCVCLCFLGMGGCLYIAASGDAKIIAAERGTAWQTNTITVTNFVTLTNQAR